MTVLNGHGDGIELILPITCSLQLMWPVASKGTSRDAELPFLLAADFQLHIK